MPNKDKILKIRISENLKSEAREIADAKGETLAVLVREALRQYLEKERIKEEAKKKKVS